MTANLILDPDYGRARVRLLRYLGMRDHSSAELATKLARYFDPLLVERVIADAKAEGLVTSDERVAQIKIDGFTRRRKSRLYIEQQLRARGLPVPARSEADDADEVTKARELVAAKFGDPLELSFEERGRAFRFLKYRGFEDRHITRVLEHEE